MNYIVNIKPRYEVNAEYIKQKDEKLYIKKEYIADVMEDSVILENIPLKYQDKLIIAVVLYNEKYWIFECESHYSNGVDCSSDVELIETKIETKKFEIWVKN